MKFLKRVKTYSRVVLFQSPRHKEHEYANINWTFSSKDVIDSSFRSQKKNYESWSAWAIQSLPNAPKVACMD